MTSTIGILVFDGVAALDVCVAAEAFSLANRVGALDGSATAFRVLLMNVERRAQVRAGNGLRLACDVTIREDPQCDVVLVPGGDVTALTGDPDVRFFLDEAAEVAAVGAATQVWPMAESPALTVTDWAVAVIGSRAGDRVAAAVAAQLR